MKASSIKRSQLTGLSGAQGVAIGVVYVYDRVQKHFPHKIILDEEKADEIKWEFCTFEKFAQFFAIKWEFDKMGNLVFESLQIYSR